MYSLTSFAPPPLPPIRIHTHLYYPACNYSTTTTTVSLSFPITIDFISVFPPLSLCVASCLMMDVVPVDIMDKEGLLARGAYWTHIPDWDNKGRTNQTAPLLLPQLPRLVITPGVIHFKLDAIRLSFLLLKLFIRKLYFFPSSLQYDFVVSCPHTGYSLIVHHLTYGEAHQREKDVSFTKQKKVRLMRGREEAKEVFRWVVAVLTIFGARFLPASATGIINSSNDHKVNCLGYFYSLSLSPLLEAKKKFLFSLCVKEFRFSLTTNDYVRR